jgi:hypothetical protein
VHEGTIRFEHCYRLDLEDAASAGQRWACWGLWLESYTYGQSRDRIEYARRRLNGAANAEHQPELRLTGDRPQEQRQFYLVVPAPTSVHATPPPVATAYRPLATDASDAGSDAAPENAKSPPADGPRAPAKTTTRSACAAASSSPRTPEARRASHAGVSAHTRRTPRSEECLRKFPGFAGCTSQHDACFVPNLLTRRHERRYRRSST